LISLLATGAVLGLALPANVPVWVAALLLFIAYGILAGPLKVARRVCYRGLGQRGWAWSFVFLLDGIVWVAVVVALLWLGVHYLPQLREAVQSVPALAHQAADDIRTWWNSK
jgi:multisubunit Na+/H+ antiporter MnhB subunit